MINTLAITVILTCTAAIAYGMSELHDRYVERREAQKAAQKAVWRQKYDKQIAERRVVRENRERIWRMIK